MHAQILFFITDVPVTADDSDTAAHLTYTESETRPKKTVIKGTFSTGMLIITAFGNAVTVV